MRCIFQLFKVTLFIFNSFYFLLGASILIFTAFLYVNSNPFNAFLQVEFVDEYSTFIYGSIGAACVLFTVGFIGCTGILNERSWILTVYFFFLFAIFSCQFTAAIFLYVKSVSYFSRFKQQLINAVKFRYGTSRVHSQAIDYMHDILKCCGWHSPNDWAESTYVDPKFVLGGIGNSGRSQNNVQGFQPLPYKIPPSCCVNNYDVTCVLMHKFHEVGCSGMMKTYYGRLEIYVAWSLAFLNMFQLTLLVLALYLLCMVIFNNREEERKRRARMIEIAGAGGSSTTIYSSDENYWPNGDNNNNSCKKTSSHIDPSRLYGSSYFL